MPHITDPYSFLSLAELEAFAVEADATAKEWRDHANESGGTSAIMWARVARDAAHGVRVSIHNRRVRNGGCGCKAFCRPRSRASMEGETSE